MSEDPRVCWSGSEIKTRLVSTCAASLQFFEHPGSSLLFWGLFVHWCSSEEHRKTLPWAEVHCRCPQIHPHVCFHKIIRLAFSGEDIRGVSFWGCLHQGHISAGVAEQLDSEHQLQSPQSFQKVFCTKQGFWVVFLATLQINLWYILDLRELLWVSTVPCQVLFLSYVHNWRNGDPITAHKLIRGTTAADHHADLTWEG